MPKRRLPVIGCTLKAHEHNHFLVCTLKGTYLFRPKTGCMYRCLLPVGTTPTHLPRSSTSSAQPIAGARASGNFCSRCGSLILRLCKPSPTPSLARRRSRRSFPVSTCIFSSFSFSSPYPTNTIHPHQLRLQPCLHPPSIYIGVVLLFRPSTVLPSRRMRLPNPFFSRSG